MSFSLRHLVRLGARCDPANTNSRLQLNRRHLHLNCGLFPPLKWVARLNAKLSFVESGCQPDFEEFFRCQVVSSSLTDAGWRILKQFVRETRSIRPAADLITSPLVIVCLGHACGETLPTGLLVISEPTGLESAVLRCHWVMSD
jgi:hypothetical protein